MLSETRFIFTKAVKDVLKIAAETIHKSTAKSVF